MHIQKLISSGHNLCSILLIFFSSISLNSLSQQPGGVSGTKIWYSTISEGNKNSLRDISGNHYPDFNNSIGINNRNINFHPATFFNISAPKQLKNFDANEITLVGIFYPTSQPSTYNPIITITYFKKTYEIFYNLLDTNNTKLLDFGDPSKNRNTFLIQLPNTTHVNAMKTGVVGIPWNKLQYTIWGNKTDMTISSKFTGYIPELILYRRKLANNEIRQIQSYLCIKYGTTLDTSYFNSKGNTIWDINSPILKEYHNRVCAIGRDSASGLWQFKSNTTYEDNGYIAYKYNADSSCSNPIVVEKFIPETDKPSLYRSLTIEFQDKDLRKVPDNQFLFWGDNGGMNSKIDTVDISQSGLKYKKADFPYLKIIKGRRWIMYNKRNLRNTTKIVIAGVDYNEFPNSLFNKLYQPYDYQRYRYVLLKVENDSIVSANLNSYFGREWFGSEEFSTRTIVWDSIDWKNSFPSFTGGFDLENVGNPYHFFTFGKIHVLNILEIGMASDLKAIRRLDYPYYKERPISDSVIYDTLSVNLSKPFQLKIDDKIIFTIPDGLGSLKATLKILDHGKWRTLPSGSISKPGDSTFINLDGIEQEMKVVDDKNKENGIESTHLKKPHAGTISNIGYSEIERRKPYMEKVKCYVMTKELYETNTFQIELKDRFGQVTVLSFKTEKPKTSKSIK